MAVQQLREFLDSNQVKYVTISHSVAYTAQEIAASAHIRGKELAKVVMVMLNGELAMAVLPASYQLDLEKLREVAGAASVRLATEAEFKNKFPGCETGAMPPFGNLYGMKVFADETLAEDEEIAFNAGTHSELVKLAWAEYARLVRPIMAKLARGR